MHKGCNAVVSMWVADGLLSARGSRVARLTELPSKKVSRRDVNANYETLLPIIEHFGMKLHIGFARELCREFLWRTRPRGQPEATCVLH